MKDYERFTEKDKDICKDCVLACFKRETCVEKNSYERLKFLENKIERGEIVEAIWFKSWISGNICCGSVIGYDENSGFVIKCGNDLISAKKIYTSREQAENSEINNNDDLPF